MNPQQQSPLLYVGLCLVAVAVGFFGFTAAFPELYDIPETSLAAAVANNYALLVSTQGSGNVSATLVATPAPDYDFAGWSGACTGTGDCVVASTTTTNVGANFTKKKYTLALTVGSGGTVTTSASGTCTSASTCNLVYSSGTSLTLNATPAAGYAFSGWSGACTNATGPCVVKYLNNQTLTAQFTPTSVTYYVSPSGLDTNTGVSATAPFKKIQTALNKVQPGDTIIIARGTYRENLQTVTAGTAAAPITIKGSDNAKSAGTQHKTVVYGTGHVFNIDHSYYTVSGFALDGQEALENAYRAANPGNIDGFPNPAALAANPTLMTAFKDQYQSPIAVSTLIYVGTTGVNITGLNINNMFLQGGGGECVRLRNSVTSSTISGSVIRYCGLHANPSSDAYLYHNGEGIYVGTSPKSTGQPQAGTDQTSFNTISNNTIYTFGSECVGVKEVAHHNTISGNDCRYNLEPAEFIGSNIELRGDHNTVSGNTVDWSQGFNVKLASDSSTYDLGGNTVKNNILKNSQSGIAVKVQQTATTFCGNTMSGSSQGVATSIVTAPCS